MVAQVATTNTALNSIGRTANRVGSAITTGITVAIVAAAAKAAQESKKIEDAWNEVRKTYNATPAEIEKLITSQGALGRSVDVLSTKYGLNRVEVIGLLGDLSAMGYTGDRATKTLTQGVEFATAAGIPLERGLSALVALTATFGLKGQDLQNTLYGLNAVENETAARGEDLAIALARAGGNAQAMTTPAFSSSDAIAAIAASMAVFKERGQETYRSANALRRIFQAMWSPTKDANSALQTMGVSLTEVDGSLRPWPQLMTDIGNGWDKLAPAQKISFVKKYIGVEFAPLFNVLIEDIRKAQDGTSTFFNTLATFGDKGKGATSFARELDIQANSLSASFGRITAGIQQMLDQEGVRDFFKGIADAITEVIKWFSNLDPRTQKLILTIVGITAVAGPLLLLLGALVTAISAIGAPVLGIIAGIGALAAWFKKLWDAGGPVVDFVKMLAETWLDMLKDAWADLVSAFETAKPVLEFLGMILGGVLLLAISLVIAAIRVLAFLIKGAVEVIKWLIEAIVGGFSKFIETMKNIGTFIGEVFGWIFEAVIGGFKTFWDTIYGIVEGIVNGIVDFFTWLYEVLVGHSIIPDMINAITKWFEDLKQWLSDIVQGIVDWIVDKWNALATLGENIWNGILNFFRTVFENIKNAITTALNAISNTWNTIWKSIETFVTTVINGIRTHISNGINAVKETISTVLNAIKTGWDTMWRGAEVLVGEIWNSIKNVVQAAINAVKGVIQAVLQAIKGDWKGAWETLRSTFENVKNAIQNEIVKWVNFFKTHIGNGLNAIRNTWNGIWDSLGQKVSAVFDSIRQTIDNVLGWFQEKFNQIGDFIGGIREKAQGVLNAIGLNKGGLVPGSGNRDTVPAMLTPGEFVLTKKAVQRIGVSNLARLNEISAGDSIMNTLNLETPKAFIPAPRLNLDDYNRMPSIDVEVPEVVPERMYRTQPHVTNINTNVYNPVAERGSDSVNRRLSKIAALGLLDSRED